MDEWMLNDLLECSVCLERLDTSSKVLPCQHTFCKKCLEDIMVTNKELRCPECRVLVDVKIDELPPNVLLMRILEGMRNAGPKKRNSTGGSVRLGGSAPATTCVAQPSSLPPVLPSNNVAPEPNPRALLQNAASVKIPSQPYARAVYDYLSKEPGDLSFKKGDLIVLRKKIDNNWYHGESGGKQGVFPLSYVQIMTPLPSHIPQCKGLYDFRMNSEEEDGCLAFTKGEVITVIRRVDENWAEGKLNDRIGIFPLAFVEMNSIARALMKLSSNAQPGPSRLAPPTPTTEDVTPLIPTDHSRTLTQVPSQPQPQVTGVGVGAGGSSDSSSSTTLTSPSSSSSSSTPPTSSAPSSPSSPPPPQPLPSKRHSFSITQLHHPHNRHSAEILSPTDLSQDPQAQSNGSPEVVERLRRASEVPAPQGSPHSSLTLPAAYVALYPYKPQKPDELELKRGSMYTVTERCQDGWFKGRANRNHKCGVFPGNYVAPAKSLSALQAQVRGLPLAHKGSPPAQPRPRTTVSYTRPLPAHGHIPSTSTPTSNIIGVGMAPELPPRSASPAPISASWHGDTTPAPASAHGVGENGSPAHQSTTTPVASTPISALTSPATKAADNKGKDKKPVSLMRRLTSMKKSRSPPSYSMDNPVFEDGSVPTQPIIQLATTPQQPVHVRSGSCPSQLLQVLPLDGSSPLHRHSRHKQHLRSERERSEMPVPTTVTNPAVSAHAHRKSNSLDGGEKRSKQLVPPIRERFRCIVAYPPNSEYELELRVGDIIYVHRKRDDGWYKGTQQRTGKTGLFPASFVESF